MRQAVHKRSRRARRELRIEQLEARQLMAQLENWEAPRTGSGRVSGAVEFNGSVYFGAWNDAGAHLWRVNDNGSGAARIATLNSNYMGEPFIRSAQPLGNKLLLEVGDTRWAARSLWVTDGTASGTLQLASLSPQEIDIEALPSALVMAGDSRAFFGTSSVHVTDGTPEGTRSYYDPNWDSNLPKSIAAIGDQLLFEIYVRRGEDQGLQLWVSDGTEAGSAVVARDIDFEVRSTASVWGKVYFFGRSIGGTTRNIYVTDGEETGTQLFLDNTAPLRTPDAWLLGGLNNELILVAPEVGASNDGYLWSADSGAPRKIFERPIWRGGFDASHHGYEQTVWIAEGRVYAILKGTGSSLRELWVSDGTPAGARRIGTISQIPASSLLLSDDVLLYTRGPDRTTLWRYDLSSGTESALAPLMNVYLAQAAIHDGVAYFPLEERQHGLELWRTDGTGPGTMLVQDIYAPTSGPSTLTHGPVLIDDNIYFTRNYGGTERTFITDGTAVGTYQGGSHSPFTRHVMESGTSYVVRTTSPLPNQRQSLSREEGAVPGKVVEPYYDSFFSWIGDVDEAPDGRPRFAAGEASVGRELWGMINAGYDPAWGRAAVIKDIVPGPGSSDPAELTSLADGRTVFLATDAAGVRQLWVTDGTEAGTVPIAAIPLTTNTRIARLGDAALITNLADGQWWITDGTAAGTRASTSSPAPGDFALHRVGGATFAIARAPEQASVWKVELEGGEARALARHTAPDVEQVTISGDRLYFTSKARHAPRLYLVRPDFEAAVPLTEEYGQSFPSDLWAMPEGGIYFSAAYSDTGRELYFADDVLLRSRLVVDHVPGWASSDPKNITSVGGRVVYSANRGDGQREVFSLANSPVVPEIVSAQSSHANLDLFDVYTGNWTVTITFNTPMHTRVLPEVRAWPEPAQQAIWPSSFRWTSPTMLEVGMTAVDAPVRMEGISLLLVGAVDAYGTIFSGETPALFSLDMTSPVLQGWHNNAISVDVNFDQRLSPLDAALVINELNARGPRVLTGLREAVYPYAFLDTSGDGNLTPLDALLVINRINSGGLGAGEPSTNIAKSPPWAEPSTDADERHHALGAALWQFLDEDEEDAEIRRPL